jgi:hypothetical protein
MKFILINFALFLFIAQLAFANVIIEEELYVVTSDAAISKKLQHSTELIIDHVGQHGFEVFGPKGTRKYLESQGLSVLDVKSIKQNAEDFLNYPSYTQWVTRVRAAVEKAPSIAKMFSIGKSHQGRDLWVVKISDNVNVDEVEPEFKYISSMHGDEITGRELMVFLIEDLISAYKSDASTQEMINNTEIFIMPSMNPDGSEKRVRYNAKNIDLNRNFPAFTRNDRNTMDNREPETIAVMTFQQKRNFSLSANFHGGAVVMNYPWDSTYDRHPFDGLAQELALDYANLNPEMRNSTEFSRGITNGADWYVLHGGMQDWSYFWHNDLQMTVELSQQKWPNYGLIPNYYKDNKDSLLSFMAKIHQGAGIKLENAISGTVAITDSNGKNLGTYAFERGEFYKILSPGLYTFNVAAGSIRQTVEVIVDADRIAQENGNFVTVK